MFPAIQCVGCNGQTRITLCCVVDIERLMFSLLTLLLRQTTGHMDIPSVQQQQIQPQSNQRTLTGIVLLSTLLTRVTVALYSSGATCKNQILTIHLTTFTFIYLFRDYCRCHVRPHLFDHRKHFLVSS